MLKKVVLISGLLFCSLSAYAGAPTLTISSNHAPIKVHPGQLFVISLKSNPSTGYQWSLVSDDKNLVKLVSHQFIHSRKKLMGAPGQEEWTFSANSQQQICRGSCAVNQVGHIRLKYTRPFENAKVKPTNFIVIVLKK